MTYEQLIEYLHDPDRVCYQCGSGGSVILQRYDGKTATLHCVCCCDPNETFTVKVKND